MLIISSNLKYFFGQNFYSFFSKVNSNGFYEETALEVATRWGHQTIINMLLQHYKFEDKVVKGCLKMAPNSNVKAQIKEYMKQNKIKSRGGFFFVCSKY